ncbi:multidrug efflux SMR transporter [Shewanella maritima]|uniref:Guanidinium exporter n=1 Tax=Shewanella maritima TaxID=2520507 RepID=A0A411PLW6_9GAMM|nr:multidrug efflux SMR transporter [Shewanella maritima]QBF84527.1 multidrug efflux SMR transporter [Shewanella maritima]
MYWTALILAGLFEIIWAVGLKLSNGLSKPLTSSFTVIALVVSFCLLAYSMKQLPLSIAYAIWVAIGLCGSAIVGVIYFGESFTLLKCISLCLIVLGVIGLKLSS